MDSKRPGIRPPAVFTQGKVVRTSAQMYDLRNNPWIRIWFRNDKGVFRTMIRGFLPGRVSYGDTIRVVRFAGEDILVFVWKENSKTWLKILDQRHWFKIRFYSISQDRGHLRSEKVGEVYQGDMLNDLPLENDFPFWESNNLLDGWAEVYGADYCPPDQDVWTICQMDPRHWFLYDPVPLSVAV